MDVVAVGLILTMVGLVALLVWEVAPWQLPRSRGEMSAVPGDDVAPDAGEAYCTDPDPVVEHFEDVPHGGMDASPAESSQLLVEIYAYLDGAR